MSSRPILLSGLASVAIVAGVMASPAQAQQQSFGFDIPAQNLGSALRAFAQKTRMQVIFDGDAMRGKRSPALRGQYSADAGLAILLQGSGLIARRNADGVVVVSRASSSASNQTQSGSPSSGEANAGSAAAVDESAGATPDILVTGTRTLNADIRRTENDTQPYVVLSGDDIQKSQARTVEEFLLTRLPMNAIQGASPQSTGSAFGNTGRVNLRGLGIAQTLILLDGRRLPSVIAPGSSQQPDLNSIPVAAIQRIEVLPATAAGIYGGGATGGAVNIILRRAYSGLEFGANYNISSRGDAAGFRLDGGGGWVIEGGKTEIMLAGSYAETRPLFVGDRDLIQRGRALQLANNPAAFFGAATPPQGYTSNIRSANGSNLILDSGTALNSPITYVPLGYAGPQSDGGRALVANAGQYNLAPPNDLFGSRQTLTSDHKEATVLLSGRRKFNDWLEAFADASWSRNVSTTFAGGAMLNSVTLAANAANNPFTTPIVVRFPSPNVVFPFRAEYESYRVAGGLIVRLPFGWRASTDYVWSRSRYFNAFTSPVVGDPDGTGPGVPAATALSNGTLDTVRDVNSFPLNWDPYRFAPLNFVRGPGRAQFDDFNFRLSGPVVTLPGGPITATAVFENRTETAHGLFEESLSVAAVKTTTYNSPRSQRVNSIYLETVVPLVSDENAMPGIAALELQGAVRHDWYKTTVGSPFTVAVPSREGPLPTITDTINNVQATGYTVGLRYQPFKGLTLRSSYGSGFLPPSINQIVRNMLPPTTASLIDPKRGSVASSVTFDRIVGGNPNLTYEESKSFSVGAIIEPAQVPGFRLSIDYTRITKANEIFASFDFQQLVDLEDVLTGRIIRATLTPADAARGYTAGAITAIDATPVNASRTRLQAIDIQADQRFALGGWGDLRLFAIATWQPQFTRKVLPNSAFVDSAGYNSGPLEWRGNAGINWTVGKVSLAWNAQYYDSYFAYSADAAPATITTTALNQGAARIPSQIYHDLSVRLDLRGETKPGLSLTFGVQNLFDKHPPVVATTASFGGYSTYGDPRLRRFNISARAKF